MSIGSLRVRCLRRLHPFVLPIPGHQRQRAHTEFATLRLTLARALALALPPVRISVFCSICGWVLVFLWGIWSKGKDEDMEGNTRGCSQPSGKLGTPRLLLSVNEAIAPWVSDKAARGTNRRHH